MYSEYLDNFKRLIGLLGEDDATQLVRSQCDSTQDKYLAQIIQNKHRIHMQQTPQHRLS
jgi:hypothetical protein